MYLITALLCVGILIGYLLREKEKVLKYIAKFTNLSIYLLLFTLGISIGANKKLIENIHQIGLKAFIIAFFSILGSIFLAFLLYHFYFKRRA